MKKILVATFIIVLLFPALSSAEMYQLSDAEMDEIHAAGLSLFISFNFYLVNSVADILVPGIDVSTGTTNDSSNSGSGITTVNIINQTVDGNSGNVLLNSVQLNDYAQQNLSAFVNFNCANCVVPFGINITVIYGNNQGTVSQINNSLGLLNSSLLFGF